MSDSKYILKSHNISVLLYHFVCTSKYREVVFDIAKDTNLKDVFLKIKGRYEYHFLEIGMDGYFTHRINRFGNESMMSKFVRDYVVKKDQSGLYTAKQLNSYSGTL